MLVALILALGPASGAHFNPVVTLVDRAYGGIETSTAALYIVVQVCGAIVGAMVANAMFDLPIVDWSTTVRSGGDLWFAEGIATLGLLVVIFGIVTLGPLRRSSPSRSPATSPVRTTSRPRRASPTRR